MEDEERLWNWPVNWSSALQRTAALGIDPETIIGQPEFAAHRTLDRLSARARSVVANVPGAKDGLAATINAMARGAPWLLESSEAIDDDKDAPSDDCGCGPSACDSILDDLGIMTLLAVAAQTANRTGVLVVQGLVSAATAAEALLPSFAEPGRQGERADLAALTHTSLTPGPQLDDELRITEPAWERLTTFARQIAAAPSIRCTRLFSELAEGVPPGPEPARPVASTTGIQRVDAVDRCTTTPKLVIRGSGFGASNPGVGVVASVWDKQTWAVVHRPASIVSWSDTEIRVAPGSTAVSGSVAFVDLNFLETYRKFAKLHNDRARAELRAAGCPQSDVVSPDYLYHVPTTPAAQYTVGEPMIVTDITKEPGGSAPSKWGLTSLHLEAGQSFRFFWRTANANFATLRGANAAGESLLSAAGFTSPAGVPGLTGNIVLKAPAQAAIVEFQVEASNADCGIVRSKVRLVVTGKPLRLPTITVLQSLPGGDIDVVSSGGVETFNPAGGRSIPLVAEKRTVVRVEWWPALPQVPQGESIEATAKLRVRNQGDFFLGGTLLPNESTAEPPSSTGVILPSGPAFSSAAQYDGWVAAGNVPSTFTFVLPAEWAKWDVILEATVSASASLGPSWTASNTVWAKFHRRRRVKIRYRRHTAPPRPTPTTEATETSLRVAASLLPIPDPEILVLGNDPAAPSNGYIEDMMRERANTPAAQWKDEIWLVVGPAGVGGVADPNAWPWTGASEATGQVSAHEIGHMFNQAHLKLCGAAQNPDDPATFPDQGNVLVTGWNTWNNTEVRNGIDLMSYCWANAWMSPERWRRIFLQVGKP